VRKLAPLLVAAALLAGCAMAERDLIVGIEPFSGEGHGILGPHRDLIHEQADYFLYFMMDLAHAAR
jgi:hypothetical protein